MKKNLLILIILGVGIGSLLQRNSVILASKLSPLLSLTLATPAPTPVPLPSRLIIPKLNIDTPIEVVGLDSQQRMAVPQDWNHAGWYQYGAKPGEIGSAVIDGHLDTTTGPALFAHLNQLVPGDQIMVVDRQNHTSYFRVVRTALYSDNHFPLESVFGSAPEARLNLITCEGVFNREQRNYSNRLVVYSTIQP